MRIMIVGGTSFLGYFTAKTALDRGYGVGSLSLHDIDLGGWYPKEIKIKYGDVFSMDENALTNAFYGYDALVYSVGPDDRITPPAPAYAFFYERLVKHCAKVFRAARSAGIRRSVVFNSYFATFHRLYPEKKLCEHHPYIRCRIEQAQRLISESTGKMDVMVLELPYIFGAMPQRTPLWKEVFIERLFRAPVIFFTKGGTTMIHARHVAEAAVGALEKGVHGVLYPVGDENHTYDQMLRWMMEGLKIKKPIVHIGKRLAAFSAGLISKKEIAAGYEPGLDPKQLMLDIMGEELYIPMDTIDDTAKTLGHGRGGVQQGIIEAMQACYPEGF